MIEFNHWDIYFKSVYDFFIFILSFIFLLNSYNKEFRDEGGLSLKPWGIALKFLFLHHENILFPND